MAETLPDLRNVNVVITAFGMPGCPACEDFLPRLERAVGSAGVPFLVYRNGQALNPAVIPVLFLDATSTDPKIKTHADRLQVESVPVTLLTFKSGPLRRSLNTIRLEGALRDDQIEALLKLAQSHL